jgi:hypothetical protein
VVNVMNVVKIQHTWPFPSECPPKPWTPEQEKKYQEEQRGKLPDAPMVLGLI